MTRTAIEEEMRAARAAGLDAATAPFHVVNRLGSLGGPRLLGRSGVEHVRDAQDA